MHTRCQLSTRPGGESVTPAHVQSYLEVFTLRFGRRSSGRGLDFPRLIEPPQP